MTPRLKNNVLCLPLTELEVDDVSAWLEMESILEIYIPNVKRHDVDELISKCEQVWNRMIFKSHLFRDEVFLAQVSRDPQEYGWHGELIKGRIDPISLSFEEWVNLPRMDDKKTIKRPDSK